MYVGVDWARLAAVTEHASGGKRGKAIDLASVQCSWACIRLSVCRLMLFRGARRRALVTGILTAMAVHLAKLAGSTRPPMCEPASLSARPHLFLSQPLLSRCYEMNHQYSKSSFQCYEVRHKLNVSASPDPQYFIFALPKEPSREAAQCSAASEQ